MNELFHIDYESRSEVEIGDKGNREGVGLYNYMHHPTTQPLMLSYALGTAQPQLWEIAKGEPMPQFVRERFTGPESTYGSLEFRIRTWNDFGEIRD